MVASPPVQLLYPVPLPSSPQGSSSRWTRRTSALALRRGTTVSSWSRHWSSPTRSTPPRRSGTCPRASLRRRTLRSWSSWRAWWRPLVKAVLFFFVQVFGFPFGQLFHSNIQWGAGMRCTGLLVDEKESQTMAVLYMYIVILRII